VQLSEPPVLSLVGRRGVLCSAGRMQNCQPLSPCMTIAPWTRARARSADLSRDPSDGGRASFQISVSAAAFFPIGSTPSAYTHIYSLPVSVCVFASVWHFPDRMSRIFARYVSPESVLCGDSLYPSSTRPQRCCGTAKLLFANELILRDVIPIGNV